MKELQNKSNRTAKYVSVLCFYNPKEKIEIYTYGELRGSIGKEEKLKHVELICTLLEKQKILYTILTLSDDPAAKQMKENIMASAKMMGLPSDVDMTVVFSNMEKLISQMKKQVQ